MTQATRSQAISPSHSKRKQDVALNESQLESSPKRQKRLVTPPTDNIRRVSKFWYDDGNVVIQIGDVQFKLYRGQLTRYSTFFADLLSRDCDVDDSQVGIKEVAAGEHMYPTLYSVPIYIVTCVDVADFIVLLSALDDSVAFASSRLSSAATASLLRASTRLSFPKFRDFAIKRLEEKWPSDLDKLGDYGIPGGVIGAVDAVLLARQYNVPGILKRALFQLVNTLITEESRTDMRRLSSADLCRVLHAREELISVWLSITSSTSSIVCHGVSPSCPICPKKSIAWYKIINSCRDAVGDAICGLDRLVNTDWEAAGFCDACVERCRADGLEKKRELWCMLDQWFELDQ